MTYLINDTYELIKQIGEGGMSKVYKARNVRLNTFWAVKQVRKDNQYNWDFLAESNILKNLNHPSLVKIVDIFEDEKQVFIIEEFVEGVDLTQVLKTQKKIPEETALRWFKELCSVLIYLHDQKPNPIIFRDMKPANIMLQKDNRLKLIDFGIAREYKAGHQSDTILAVSRGYAAPEQYNGKVQSDRRTDIYALGVTMHHLVTGKSPLEPPYEIKKVRELDPHLSAGIEYIIDKCTKQEPEDRYQNAHELLYDLEHIYVFDEAYKAYKKKKRSRIMIILALFISGLLCIGGGYVMLNNEIEAAYQSLLHQAASAEGETAVELYQQAQKERPTDPIPYEGEIRKIYQTGDYSNVINRAMEMENAGNISMENNPSVYVLVGSSYFELSDYDHAAETYKYLIDNANVDDFDVKLNYAAAVGRTGDMETAQKIIDELKTSTDDTHADYMQAELNYLMKDYPSAEVFFRKVLDSSKTSDELRRRSYIALAETYRDQAALLDSAEAEEYQTKLITLINEAQNAADMGSNTVLWEMKGQAYAARGRLNNDGEDMVSAAEAYNQVLKIGINKPYIYVNIFTCYESAGRHEDAAAILDAYEKAWPQSFEPHAYRALMLAQMQNGKTNPDYSEVKTEYELAKELMKSTDNAELIAQLESLMDLLEQNGY